MATFLTPSQIQATYLQILKSIKPSLNINDLNSDFVLRGQATSGLVSGLYGDQAKVNGDTFTATARPEALVLKGQDLGLTLNAATVSSGTVTLTGTTGTVIAAGALTFIYPSTSLLYTNTTGGTFVNGQLVVTIQSETTGAVTNIALPDTLTVVSPPSGVSTTASLYTAIAGASDVESYDSFRARILARQQNTPSGGDAADYLAWGYAANSAVRSVSLRRFINGLGTVGVIITTGVTDVDDAVTQGLPVVRIPSASVISSVQAYYDANAPITACTVVFAPTEVLVPVTIYVDISNTLTLSSVPSSSTYNPLGLTVSQLITREVGRSLYETSIGGRTLSGSVQGYVVASDIEQSVLEWLGPQGNLPCLDDVQVAALNGASYDLPIGSNSLAAPGVITTVVGVP